MKGSEKSKLSGLYSSKTQMISQGKKSFDSNSLLPSGFPVNNKHYEEDTSKRTLTSRAFNDGHGGVIIQYGSKKINYLDKENKFQPIDEGLQFFTNEWVAKHQQYPTYLHKDGSTSISSDEKNKIIFNQNCKINKVGIDFSDYTVGEEGMQINNVISGIDKKIIFYENMIETDYILRQPINTGNQDVIISEEIVLPEGYYTSALSPLSNWRGAVGEAFVVYSPDKKEQARFKTPVFYDANNMIVFGNYNLIQEAGKNILQIVIPGKWLNDAKRVYPVTIDPVVTGPTANYPATFMNSCEYPNFEKDSILITIPADITITKFIVEDSYFADLFATPTPTLLDGYLYLSTVCNTLILSCSDPAASSLPGTCYIVPNTDFKSYLSCCFSPSCSIQTFYLVHGFARSNLGPGCNQTYIYYSPLGTWPFSAFIVGNTVETTQAEWSVYPTTVCSDSCTVFLEATTNYGVPPYTITHPWASGSPLYGTAIGSCNSTGTETIALTIPGCPTTCGTSSTLSIPPPIIVDVCGDTVAGLSSKSITIKPVPVATAPVASVCSGSALSIPISSCVTGSTFQWTGSNGSSGTGGINDVVYNTGPTLMTVNYTVIPTASGCVGPSIIVPAEIDTLPIINGGLNDTIEPGVSTQLNATGGLTYFWTPSAGLSCINCNNPLATPVITTSYYITGTNEYGCSSGDTVNVFVKQGDEVLYIPNSFTPNDNFLNDLFCVYGTSIKKIDIQIYDRWGEMIFRSNDVKLGWDGKYRGKNVEGGVYVYKVDCEWLSGMEAHRNGIVTVIR